MNAIRRHIYNLLSSLTLWHMDGNHKLIPVTYLTILMTYLLL